jgi:hypothetical protein
MDKTNKILVTDGEKLDLAEDIDMEDDSAASDTDTKTENI